MPRNPKYHDPEALRADAARRQREYRAREFAKNPDFYKAAAAESYAKYPWLWTMWAGPNREALRQATPPWVDRKALAAVWRDRPDGMQVDHIIPINGETVSGINVPWNLQYLTPAENARKGNKFDPSSIVPSGSIL